MEVSERSVRDHEDEEEDVEIGKNVSKATDKTPRQSHADISRVVQFSAVCPQSVDEQCGARLGLEALNSD